MNVFRNFPVGELEVYPGPIRSAERHGCLVSDQTLERILRLRPGSTVLERRREERLLTLKTGKIRVPGGTPDIECAIFDVSRTGACILLPKGADLPTTFDLTIDQGEMHHACKLAWKAGHKIGVRFQTAAAT